MMLPKNTANEEWRRLLLALLSSGTEASPRGKKTREIMGFQTRVDMRKPVLTTKLRKLGYRFLCAEAAWILSGDNRVETISPYSKQIADFSDDHYFFHGAYGPKIVDQLTHVVDSLIADKDSRQAVINIWRENPRKTKDVPCTISVQFMIRSYGLYPADTLSVVDTMRSSDAWLGWPYDVFNFSMLAGYVALLYRERTGIELRLGDLILTAGSQHIYEPQFKPAGGCLVDPSSWDYAEFDPLQFTSPQSLVDHLWGLADRGHDTTAMDFESPFLMELLD